MTWAIKILIDPGHGGEDMGAQATHVKVKQKVVLNEKDITLNIAKMMKEYLSPYFQVHLTRSIDSTVTLEKRAELAEKLKADLFISIHVNSSSKRSAHGFETYFLDNHKDSAVKKVESIENRNLKGESLEVHKILTDLVIDRTVVSSRKLAHLIHGQVKKKIGKRYKAVDRGVKPGLFYVLALSKRPGVLLEVGFLSHSKERKRLVQRGFQRQYAKAAAEGVIEYFNMIKSNVPLF